MNFFILKFLTTLTIILYIVKHHCNYGEDWAIRNKCDTHENSGISCSISYISYIGQCDLINTCFGLLQVWYTLGGSVCRICHLTSKEFIFILIGSY